VTESIDDQLTDLRAGGPRFLAAQLVMPVLDLRESENPSFAEACRLMAALPWNGFIIFGGEHKQVARITRSLRRIAASKDFPRPWFASDVERGLGQQVAGGTVFPPFESLGAAPNGAALAERLGRAIADESLALGIDWLFSPVLDLADLRQNPIVGHRSFGAEPERVAELGAAFIRGVEVSSALACGKHFPGHGGTLLDSHDSLAKVEHSAERLRTRDLASFRAAIAAGCSSFMTAHVAYPALDDAATPATLSPAIARGLLRDELGFDGIVVSDALIMSGVLEPCDGGEGMAACRALDAGCDVLLYPRHPEPTVEALAVHIAKDEGRAGQAIERILRRKLKIRQSEENFDSIRERSRALALELGQAAIRRAEGTEPLVPGEPLQLVLVDDDDAVDAAIDSIAALQVRAGELNLHVVTQCSSEDSMRSLQTRLRDGAGAVLLLIHCSVRAWKCRSGLAPELASFCQELAESLGGRLRVAALAGRHVVTPLGLTTTLAYGTGPACEERLVEALYEA